MGKEGATLSPLPCLLLPPFLSPKSFSPALLSSHLLTLAQATPIPTFHLPRPPQKFQGPCGMLRKGWLFPGRSSSLSAPGGSNQLPETLRNCFSARRHQTALEGWSIVSRVGNAISQACGVSEYLTSARVS